MSKKINRFGLDQYNSECFGRLIFATVRKSVGTERVKQWKDWYFWFSCLTWWLLQLAVERWHCVVSGGVTASLQCHVLRKDFYACRRSQSSRQLDTVPLSTDTSVISASHTWYLLLDSTQGVQTCSLLTVVVVVVDVFVLYKPPYLQ